MEKYIPKNYKIAIDMLEPVINKYKLDKIAVESLVRSSIEIEDQEIQPVTAIWRSTNGKVYSTKPSNIKVNLKFALDLAFRLKTTFTQKDIWFGIAIIDIIVALFTSATKEIDEFSSIVLLSVYRRQHRNIEEIIEYVEKICSKNSKNDISKEIIKESLEKLESWGCIRCIDGLYEISETVTASMIKEHIQNQ